jgi:serine/threonine protein kinase
MMDSPSSLPFGVGDILTDYAGVSVQVRAVAEGGFGLVAFGPDVGLSRGRWLALKTVRPEVLRRSPQVRDLFIREALTWVGVWPHANIVTAQFVTEINGLPFLVLDYAEQGALRRHMRPGLPVELAFTWAQHIAAGMAHLHTPDPIHLRPDPIIHRDLKPDNILLRDLGDSIPSAQITDFGLAKTQAAVAQAEAMVEGDEELEEGTALDNTRSQRYRTERGSALGTPAYMAPEQWADAASAGPAADVYAFGLILGELLIGQHPLLALDQRHSKAAWRQAHLAGARQPLPVVFPLPLHHLYSALLLPDPTQRPTMTETFAELQATARRLNLPIYTVPEIDPPTAENQRIFWQSWANAYDRFDMHAEALLRNDRAFALAPQNPSILANRATILAQLGRIAESLALFAGALRALPPDDHHSRMVIWHQQGLLFNNLKRYAEADVAYAAALREMPSAADTWYNRAVNFRLWGEQEIATGDEQHARDHFRQALDGAREPQQINPHDRDTPGVLARIGVRLNESALYAEAEEAYALAVQNGSGWEDGAIWYNRALNLAMWGRQEARTGQTTASREHLRDALIYTQMAQQHGLADPKLPALINAIQQTLAMIEVP